MKRLATSLLVVTLVGRVYPQDDPDKVHTRIYKKVAPATVYVESQSGRHRGSGVIIDKSGIIATSPAACGPNTEVVSVLVKGGKSYTGRVMGRLNELELVLVKIDGKDSLSAIELGDSDGARVGQVSYVLGDCFDSLRADDQPAMSMGVISGIYEIAKSHPGTYYKGKVLETSAAVNPNQGGGALVDKDGKLLGLVTLNYDEAKFTGLAIPINVLKPGIAQIKKEFENPAAKVAPKPVESPAKASKPGDAWFGVEVAAVKGGLEVTRVARKSPAHKAGLQKGDVLVAIDSVKLLTEAALTKALASKSAGEVVAVTVLRDGEKQDLRVTLASKPLY